MVLGRLFIRKTAGSKKYFGVEPNQTISETIIANGINHIRRNKFASASACILCG